MVELASDADEPNRLVYNVRANPDLPESENMGIELSIPSGQWVWKFEYVTQKTSTDLEGFSEDFGSSTLSGQRKNYQEYLQEVYDRGGNLYVPVKRTFLAIGADTNRNDWRFNLSLFAFNESYEDKDKPLIQAEDAADLIDGRGKTFVFPAVNIARYRGGDKSKEIGMVAGFLGSYAGISFYSSSHIGDNFRWAVSLDAASNIRDQLAGETGPNSERYELADDISTGARISMSLTF